MIVMTSVCAVVGHINPLRRLQVAGLSIETKKEEMEVNSAPTKKRKTKR